MDSYLGAHFHAQQRKSVPGEITRRNRTNKLEPSQTPNFMNENLWFNHQLTLYQCSEVKLCQLFTHFLHIHMPPLLTWTTFLFWAWPLIPNEPPDTKLTTKTTVEDLVKRAWISSGKDKEVNLTRQDFHSQAKLHGWKVHLCRICKFYIGLNVKNIYTHKAKCTKPISNTPPLLGGKKV